MKFWRAAIRMPNGDKWMVEVDDVVAPTVEVARWYILDSFASNNLAVALVDATLHEK
jgi:hypothetical protein